MQHFLIYTISSRSTSTSTYISITAKILVTTGNPIGNGQKIEIIDLDNFHFKCELMADSLGRGGSVGGLIDNQPLICGGNSHSNEFENGIILGHHNRKVQTIEPNRAYASSVVLDNTALWVSHEFGLVFSYIKLGPD